MNERYVAERITEYSGKKGLYDEFASQVLGILKVVIAEEYPQVKIASYSHRAKEIESLRKNFKKINIMKIVR